MTLRERLIQEKIGQYAKRRADNDEKTKMPKAGAGSQAMMATLKRIADKAEPVAYLCDLCKDVGLILREEESPMGGKALWSKPCRDCDKGLMLCQGWDRRTWNKAQKKGGTKAPPFPDWLDGS